MKNKRFVPLALAFAFSLFSANAADIFLKLTNIPGESKDPSHLNEIELTGWEWGLTNAPSSIRAVVSDLSITKLVDKASPMLLLKTFESRAIQEAVIVVRRDEVILDPWYPENPVEFLKITLNNVYVTGVSSEAAAANTALTEKVTLKFDRIRFEYWPVNPDGTTGNPVPFGWDLIRNSSL